MSAAFLAAAPVFEGGGIERTIRVLFALGFLLALAAFAGFWIVGRDLIAVEVSIIMVDWLVLIVGGSMLTIMFHRVSRGTD